MKKGLRIHAVTATLVALLLVSSIALFQTQKSSAAPANMTFTTGTTFNFTSNIEMSFWSGITMTFGTNVTMQFIDLDGDGYLKGCDVIHIMWPIGFLPELCTWWEVLDPITGLPIGEIHIDGPMGPGEVHIDGTWPPQPIPIPPGPIIITAVKKITIVDHCEYFTVHRPVDWWPGVCTWWEIMDPETGEATGFEFHVDWNNESCEFHIDDVIPGPYFPPMPVYELVARKKITAINTCDVFQILTPVGFDPADCSWWEIIHQGLPTGLEFHVDHSSSGIFHVDATSPTPLKIPPTYPTVARKKVDVIIPCGWYRADPAESVPMPDTWWRIMRPNVGDIEFHVDESYQDGTFHIDNVFPTYPIPIGPVYEVEAMLKIEDINACDWFTVIDPAGFLPTDCSWWTITKPSVWAGAVFHVDMTDGVDRFHIDAIDPLPPGPVPPPWNVTAEEVETPPSGLWFLKKPYPDYAPSGMPDFDQKQDGWFHQAVGWSWCGPVSVANSLWWLDSEYESIYFPTPVPPPAISDHFNLVTAYGQWDDHDPQNVIPLVNYLSFLMDTDGIRTGLYHTGTNYIDMETGISQYLQQQGINPLGDCDGDGDVDDNDLAIMGAAMGSIPGDLNWDMDADIDQNNIVDDNDWMIIISHYGEVGMFYEHTVDFPVFPWIEEEIYRCEDVVLLLEVWNEVAPGLWVKWEYDPGGAGGHYVTCAGVNSSTSELLISDPWQDAYEAGMVPGRSPVAHLYPHGPAVHNDAQLVSHDDYFAQPWMGPTPSPYGMIPVWELMPYPATWGLPPTWHAFIRAAVVTSPIRDVAITRVTTTKDGCLPVPTVGEGMPVTIDVVVENQGGFPENFTVRIYANLMEIYSQSGSLMPKAMTTVSYTWIPTGIAHITYTITGSVDSVPGETDLGDNSFGGGTLQVVVPGNINGDGAVDSTDLGMMGGAWGAFTGDPNWNPNADLDDNGVIDSTDLGIMGGHWGEFEP